MRMILCKRCGKNLGGHRHEDDFRDKCQACGKIRNCYKWDIVIKNREEKEYDGNFDFEML